ncbi:MAG: cobalamin B12-binding domain-containing protein [Anaerolinea sp.]|nr:cobalamin B12-binding domain-containing protein [Anaerolinea sp.]MCC6973534.1 cobalamin-dependent protein [Anaerolineae bacterium]
MRILLVNPPSGDLTVGLKYLAKVEPLGLEIIGGAVPEHEVDLLDMELDTDLDGALKRFNPDIVGASAQVVQTYTAQRVFRTAKAFNDRILTVLGGHHATLCPEEFNSPYIDVIVIGEGVPAFREIVARWAQRQVVEFEDIQGLGLPRDGHIHFTEPRPFPANLDHMPQPKRSLTDKYRSRYYYLFENSVASIQTSLGCTFPCNFCSCQHFTNRRFITRSPELIVEDLKTIREDFIMFCDDHTFIDVKRMERLHDLIAAAGIKKRYFAYTRTDCVVKNPEIFAKWSKIGLMMVMTGLEAIDDTRINEINKKTSIEINEKAIQILAQNGIALSAGFLVMPDYTEADFQRIDSYVRKHPNIALTELTPLTPLPGTGFHREMREKVTTHHREVYDLAHFVIPTTKLSQAEMYRLIQKYYFRVVLRAIRRFKLYRPRAALKRHIPQLLLGAMRNSRLIKNMHMNTSAPVPTDVV